MNAPKQLYIPNDIKKITREYLFQNDSFLCWFEDNYEQQINDKNAYITIKSIYNEYKSSNYYNNLNRKEKKNTNEKTFKQSNILENIKLKKYYCERKKINGKDEYSILLTYKRKEDTNNNNENENDNDEDFEQVEP